MLILVSKLIKLYALNMYSILYVNHTSGKWSSEKKESSLLQAAAWKAGLGGQIVLRRSQEYNVVPHDHALGRKEGTVALSVSKKDFGSITECF